MKGGENKLLLHLGAFENLMFQSVFVGEMQALQRRLRQLLLGHVAQRLDHCDQLAVFVIDRTGIDRQIEAFADARHDAPNFGA